MVERSSFLGILLHLTGDENSLGAMKIAWGQQKWGEPMLSGIKRCGVVTVCFISLWLVGCVEEVVVQSTAGQNLPGLQIVPTTNQLHVAEASVVEIRLHNAVDLYGLHLSLEFDPAFLQVQDADPSQEGIQVAAGGLPAPDFTVVNDVDNARGLIEYAVTQLNPRQPAQGDGVVAWVYFEGVDAGISSLTFSYAKLANPQGQEVPVQLVNATLEVDQLEVSAEASRRTAGTWVWAQVQGGSHGRQ